mmetsp:Transcript_46769/g.107833  ORF Transcript_46769/g.107833 Transcript_46769/m.107833 type:complete len:123 (+) Transcript_46769:150-518(+)
MTEVRRAFLVEKLTFKGTGYNILSGAETGGSMLPMRHPERKHGRDSDRATGLGSDKEAFRLKDSTHRFFADALQMPSKPVRTANLVREGLDAQRTSTIIGVGHTIRHEIPSLGARDAFTVGY